METPKSLNGLSDVPEAKKLLKALETITEYYDNHPNMYTAKNWRYIKDISDDTYKKSQGNESLMRKYVVVMMKLGDALRK